MSQYASSDQTSTFKSNFKQDICIWMSNEHLKLKYPNWSSYYPFPIQTDSSYNLPHLTKGNSILLDTQVKTLEVIFDSALADLKSSLSANVTGSGHFFLSHFHQVQTTISHINYCNNLLISITIYACHPTAYFQFSSQNEPIKIRFIRLLSYSKPYNGFSSQNKKQNSFFKKQNSSNDV